MSLESLHQMIVFMCFMASVFVVAVMFVSICLETLREAGNVREKTSTARNFHGILPEEKMIGSGGETNYGSKPHFISGR